MSTFFLSLEVTLLSSTSFPLLADQVVPAINSHFSAVHHTFFSHLNSAPEKLAVACRMKQAISSSLSLNVVAAIDRRPSRASANPQSRPSHSLYRKLLIECIQFIVLIIIPSWEYKNFVDLFLINFISIFMLLICDPENTCTSTSTSCGSWASLRGPVCFLFFVSNICANTSLVLLPTYPNFWGMFY